MIRFLLLALTLFACACNTGHKTVRVIDQGLTADTQAAVDAWNEKLDATCPGVSLTLVDSDEADITVTYGLTSIENSLATTSHDRERIVVNLKALTLENTPRAERGESLYAVRGALTHEFGHALGAEHSADEADVMFPKTFPGNAPELTSHDVWQVCRLYDGVP